MVIGRRLITNVNIRYKYLAQQRRKSLAFAVFRRTEERAFSFLVGIYPRVYDRLISSSPSCNYVSVFHFVCNCYVARFIATVFPDDFFFPGETYITAFVRVYIVARVVYNFSVSNSRRIYLISR